MSEAGELRKTVSRWLDAMPARVQLEGGPIVSKADIRGVVDVLQNHVQYKTGLVCESGRGAPLDVNEIARKVGLGRNRAGRILAALDEWGLTTCVSRGGVQRSTVRMLNLGFDASPVALHGCNGTVTSAVDNGGTPDPAVAPVECAVAPVECAVAPVECKSEPDRSAEVLKGVSDASLASSLEGRSDATPSRPPSTASRPSVATTVDEDDDDEERTRVDVAADAGRGRRRRAAADPPPSRLDGGVRRRVTWEEVETSRQRGEPHWAWLNHYGFHGGACPGIGCPEFRRDLETGFYQDDRGEAADR